MLQKFDCYDGLCFCGGLVFFAPVALLVRTQAGVSQSMFFVLQALLSITIFLGEIPTGMLADRLGYKRTLVVSQFSTLLARVLLMSAFLLRSPALFAAEAIVEGLAACFSSGTADAYLYEIYGKERYMPKCAQAANWGTAGFIFSTLLYGLLYPIGGIPLLLMATVLSSAVAAICSLGLRQEEGSTSGCPARPRLKELLRFAGQREALILMILSSVFSVAGILINFFYADKLLSCGLNLEWMSPIILTYSLVEMLAKPILEGLAKFPGKNVLGLSCALAAAALMLFGLLHTAVPVVFLMVALPLLLSLPGFFLGEAENTFIDSFSRGENRASNLSVLNMGVSLVEILALFASAALTGLGSGVCFLATGLALLGFGIHYLIKAQR